MSTELYEQKIKSNEVLKFKIISVAEMFEKKTISENRYSLEILCDFIMDKVRKLMTKLECNTQVQA